MKVQLLYFEGCPNIDRARSALRDAMVAEGVIATVEEVDLRAADAPADLRGWGSPTILIDGADVQGATRSAGSSCRLYKGGAPSVDDIRARLTAARPPAAAASRRSSLPMLGAIAAAVAASACCVVPAILAVVGLSGAGFGTALAPYRVHLLVATGIALAVAFWLVYRRQQDACGCEAPRTRRASKLMLWLTTALVIGVAGYPLLVGGAASAGSQSAPAKATLHLTISGMDCAECTGAIAKRIGKVPGVVSATVDYHSGVATIRHDDRAGLTESTIAAVRAAGFSAKVAP